VLAGGAAWQLPEPQKRSLFVETNGKLGVLDISNSSITKELLGALNHEERKALIYYIRGFEDLGITPRAKALGDILHSTPTLFSYSNAEADQVALVGTNEGFVHLFNRKTGVEEFAFMPGELLKNIKPIKANKTSNSKRPHPYGVDNSVTLWQNEKQTYAYVTLRRGGRGMYALDLSQRQNPKLLWKIEGGKSSGFERLGQTWSQPVKSQIQIGSQKNDVLIFAGGYDPTEDNFNQSTDAYRTDDALGNAIYIVDAKTGKKLSSASHSEASLNLADMRYSMPARVRVIDIDGDGLADQLFIGDTGGQIWRLFIHNGKMGADLLSASGSFGNEAFAKLGKNTAKEARRFYHEVDAALDKSKGGRLLLNIGSGYHAHPLNTQVNDRFYSLKADLTQSKHSPITEADLYQAPRVFSTFNKDVTVKAIDRQKGWYLPLRANGEKVLSSSISVRGTVFFNTYVPSTGKISGCEIALGKNYVYRLRIDTATPPAQLIKQSTSLGTVSSFVMEPLTEEAKAPQGISGNAGIVRIKGQSYVLTGGRFYKIKTSACKNPKGCKTFWMDKEPS